MEITKIAAITLIMEKIITAMKAIIITTRTIEMKK